MDFNWIRLYLTKANSWAEFVPQPMKPIMNTNEKDTSLKSCLKILRARHTVKLSLIQKNLPKLVNDPPFSISPLPPHTHIDRHTHTNSNISDDKDDISQIEKRVL